MMTALSLRTEASGGLLRTRYGHFGFHKMRGFFPPVEIPVGKFGNSRL
jgi:hypothetical protein